MKLCRFLFDTKANIIKNSVVCWKMKSEVTSEEHSMLGLPYVIRLMIWNIKLLKPVLILLTYWN
jgi:hypothetical protein